MLALASAASAAVRLVAPGGSDSGDCLAVPCASLRYAYSVAAAGDVDRRWRPAPTATRRCRRATRRSRSSGLPGNKIRQLHNDADNVTFDGLDLDAGGAKTNGAVFENHGGGANVTFKNSRVGNVVDQKGAMIGGLRQHRRRPTW